MNDIHWGLYHTDTLRLGTERLRDFLMQRQTLHAGTEERIAETIIFVKHFQ